MVENPNNSCKSFFFLWIGATVQIMRALDPKKTVSPRDLARAIGMSESSLKRWADQGILEVSRTAGGHRRIQVKEAIRFVRARKLSLAVPSALGLSGRLSEVGQGNDPSAGEGFSNGLDAEIAPFVRLLEAGDGETAELYLLGKYLSGVSIAEIGDRLIRPSLEYLGHGPHGAEEILKEHRATQVCLQSIEQMRAMSTFEHPRFRAVGGGGAGDSYMLPSLLVAAVIEESGGRATNLGANTPVRALRCEAFSSESPRGHADLVWLSVSEPIEDEDELAALAQLIEECEHEQVHLMLGGRAVSSLGDLARPNPFFSFHDSLSGIHASIQQLFGGSKARFSA